MKLRCFVFLVLFMSCWFRISHAVTMGFSGGSGEINTLSSVGTATSIVSGKVGVDLQIKSLAGIGGTTITNRGNYLEVNSTSVPTFASQAEAEGGTETTKSMNSLRTYQAVTSYSFLKSNIDISPVDGYPDKANGFIGTTLSADDNVTWNMNANKGFNIALSGTGKLTTSFGTNTSTLNASPFVDYIWTGNSSINADTNGSAEVDLFNGVLTASSNINCIWEIDFVIEQTNDATYTPIYKIYLDGSSTATFMSSSAPASNASVYYSGWIANYGNVALQLLKSPNTSIYGGTTAFDKRLVNLFDSRSDISIRLTGDTEKTSGSFYSSLRYLRIKKTQP